MNEEYEIACTCTFGLEKVLKNELYHLKYEVLRVTDGTVYTKGGIKDILKLNMWLRTCERVFIALGEGKAETFDELFDLAQAVPWENFFEKNARFDVSKVSCVKSKLMSETDCQKIVKKAAVNRLMKHYRTGILPESGAYYQIFIKIRSDQVRFFLNTSGESLHKRGYRARALDAPIKETLAAGIVLLSKYNETKQFSDVMCGSGTIVIEAAMLGANIAPGLHRSFAAEGWNLAPDKLRRELNEEAYASVITPSVRLLGSDIDPKAVTLSIENATRAGVDTITAFQKSDLSEFRSRKKCGVMVVNPPYGVRLGERKKMPELYSALNRVYESLDDWQLGVISAYPDFEQAFGLKADKNRKLFNGNMLSYLYFYN